MAMEIIWRNPDEVKKQSIQRVKTDAPQVAYNSEGRITVRVPLGSGDVLVVFDRPLSKELIRFIKSGITELPNTSTWCSKCATEFTDEGLPF